MKDTTLDVLCKEAGVSMLGLARRTDISYYRIVTDTLHPDEVPLAEFVLE